MPDGPDAALFARFCTEMLPGMLELYEVRPAAHRRDFRTRLTIPSPVCRKRIRAPGPARKRCEPAWTAAGAGRATVRQGDRSPDFLMPGEVIDAERVIQNSL
jgi:hypothetical protein